MIYLHEFIKKTTQGKDLSINLDTLPKNNLIQFPIHDDITSNEEVGVWVDKLFKKTFATKDSRSTDQLSQKSDPAYQLAEILLENGII